jgi:hypothetical protein
MPKVQKTFLQFEQIAHQWLKDIELYTDEQFLRKPADDQWSIGQVYIHLINSVLNFHLKQIEICAAGRGTVIKGGKKVPGVISYTFGALPPVRIKVPPSPAYTPQQPNSKEEVKEKLKNVIRSVKDIQSEVLKASQEQKTEHPGLGYLNAQEWYLLIPMHYHHHRRQQARLHKFLGM